MKILGIETSCDETAAAVVQDGTKIISNVVASSQAMHAKYGGIIPEKAAREQGQAMVPVLNEALSQLSVLGYRFSDKSLPVNRFTGGQEAENRKRKTDNRIPLIDAIAVTVGPGLIGSLLVGVETAKALAFTWGKPIVPVNHLVGHIYGNWLTDKMPEFPALVLLVSGGHTELILMKGHGGLKLLGGTRDDAAGECFDKCARILNLGYPGGPAIEKAAIAGKISPLPRPMINDKNFDFSFSGLKTAVLYRKNENPSYLAWELQEAVTDVLVAKVLKAAQKYSPKSILLAGGVAANRRLREKMQLHIARCTLHIPPVMLCTDNAAYIASAAYFNYQPIPWKKINADPSLNL